MDVSSQSLNMAQIGCLNRLQWAIALLPLVTITALSKSGHYYGFYIFSSSSALCVNAFASDADDA
jgi:hypothetical protein